MSIIAPQTPGEVPVFYLFWVALFCAINIIWDVRSGRTPAFHIGNLGQKTPVAFSAASFVSSLLLLIGLLDKATMKVAGDTYVPILLAGMEGSLIALQDLRPYKPPVPPVAGPPAPAIP